MATETGSFELKILGLRAYLEKREKLIPLLPIVYLLDKTTARDFIDIAVKTNRWRLWISLLIMSSSSPLYLPQLPNNALPMTFLQIYE